MFDKGTIDGFRELGPKGWKVVAAIFGILVTVSTIIWLVTHLSAKPGTQIRILGGLIEYTKDDNMDVGDPDSQISKDPFPNTPKVRTILRLHGSDTIGKDLAPVLAQAFLEEQGASNVVTLAGADSVEKIVKGRLDAEIISVEIKAHGSQTAFTDLAAGVCDVGMASRKIKEEERKNIEEAGRGNLAKPECEYVIGSDGIATIVNKINPVRELSFPLLKDIFQGRKTDWREIDPNLQGDINVYTLDEKSGTFREFQKRVLKVQSGDPFGKLFEDHLLLSNRVSEDPLGIGFVSSAYIGNAKSIALRASDDSMALLPDAVSLASEDYCLSRPLYLYVPDPASNFATGFVRFASSPRGQKIIESMGFVPRIVVEPPPPEPEPESGSEPESDPYLSAIRGATRLPVYLRFASNDSELNARARDDLARAIEYLHSHKTGTIIVLGFSDNQGTTRYNLKLSEKRAQVVADILRNEDFRPTVKGFGKIRQLAPDDTEENRAQNRRVEIWMR